MSKLSRDEADQLISDIRAENGGLSVEDREATRPSVLKALANVRRKLGAATKTLATNLYSKDTRFVYELIQNAEDNTYTRAESHGQEPYLSFDVFSDRIVIDSNEDGFCEEHVRAICSTGESTKTEAKGYIGEKGIGFKSVFKVAKSVHIQSGPFSFSFEYTRDSDDDGLGMVTPLNEEFESLPADVGTRMTLTLLDSATFRQRVEDLRNIPDSLLLFLTKLHIFQVKIHSEDSSPITTMYRHLLDSKDGMERIIKTKTSSKGYSEDTDRFYVTRRLVEDLPHDEARKYTREASTVVAFPVDEHSAPLLRQQHVFAYLPLRQVGFPFLIQSDFVTQASREDVFHSPRNEALLSSVAETFRDAVLRFCEHPSLQYQWMRYLPPQTISDEFWKGLRPQIISRLSQTRCIRSGSGKGLYLPRDLSWIVPSCQDRFGNPLFADLPQEIYLSSNYALQDIQLIKLLGLNNNTFKAIFERARADLRRLDSKFKDSRTEDDWHTRAAKFLFTPFGHGLLRNIELRNLVKSLPLIPVQKGRWKSIQEAEISWPTTGDISIPTDLKLDLVELSAIKNTARKRLFKSIGVTDAGREDVISAIIRRYCEDDSQFTLADSVSHLRYLYWNLPKDEITINRYICLIDSNTNLVYRSGPSAKRVYFEEAEERYEPGQLFGALMEREIGEDPNLTISLLDPKYMTAVPASAHHNSRTFREWMEKCVGVSRFPPLCDKNQLVGISISEEFSYIIQYCPEELIGLLAHHWSDYQKDIKYVEVRLRNSEVPTEGGMMTKLHETFLPLPKLTKLCRELKLQRFPFLTLPVEISDEDETKWQFLSRLGVKDSTGPNIFFFYVEALERLWDDNKSISHQEAIAALFEIYGAIEVNCVTPWQNEDIKEVFEVSPRIHVPSGTGTDMTSVQWITSTECVWSGPDWLESKRPLKGISSYADRSHLFQKILNIRDATWEDYLEDLRILKAQGRDNHSKVIAIYERIWHEFEHKSESETLKNMFEEEQLLFIPSQNTWCASSSCLWADEEVHIPGKYGIKNSYSHLRSFFFNILSVQEADLRMHVQALKQLSEEPLTESTIPKMKNKIILISSLHPTANDVVDLQESNIFCVILYNQTRTFANKNFDFAIADRAGYAAAFAGKISVLDFSIEEVRAARPLLLALGLEGKKLSELVKEETTVQDGSLILDLTQSLRSKAYAIFRLATHYNSFKCKQHDMSLYQTLLEASIYESDGISRTISLVQNGQTITVENSRANFHLDEIKLGLYVPRDENEREECFLRQLPRGLLGFLRISDPAAEAILCGIISSRNLIVIDNILRDAGIVEVPEIDRSVQPAPLEKALVHRVRAKIFDDTPNISSTPTKSSARVGLVTPPPTISRVTEQSRFMYSSPSGLQPEGLGSNLSRRLFSESTYDEGAGLTMSQINPPSSAFRDNLDSSWATQLTSKTPYEEEENHLSAQIGYVTVLERIIENAKQVWFPQHGKSSVSPEREILSRTSIFALRSPGRDRLVGAAGELFVFEMLLNLELPGFKHKNWKSTIRKEVCVHEKYQNMEPWNGSETADITYSDVDGVFTKLLIKKGYLEKLTWQYEQPKYYIEVKTTPRDCDAAFYMSGGQFKRMKRMRLEPEASSPEVYILCRVFDIETSPSLRVYVDPENCRKSGELNFEVDTWVVNTT